MSNTVLPASALGASAAAEVRRKSITTDTSGGSGGGGSGSRPVSMRSLSSGSDRSGRRVAAALLVPGIAGEDDAPPSEVVVATSLPAAPAVELAVEGRGGDGAADAMPAPDARSDALADGGVGGL